MENEKESHSSAFLGTNKDLQVGKIRLQTSNDTNGELPMNTHVLVKLRSGEEIIATMVSKGTKGLIVQNPMLLRHVPFMDYNTGSLKAATIMEDWLARGEVKEITIPHSWIGFSMNPNQEVIESYTKYLDKQKEEPKPEEPTEEKKLEDEMTKILNDLVNDAKNMPPGEHLANMMSNMDFGKPKDMVTINFDIPPNLFKELLEEGLLSDIMGAPMEDDEVDDEEFFAEDKKKIKDNIKKSSGSTLSWGNDYEDWSPDPSDYLK